MTLKSDAKFKEKLTCCFTFKFDIKNLVNFHPNTQNSNGMKNWVKFHYSTQKFEKLYIDGFFLPKAYNVSATKFQRDYIIII